MALHLLKNILSAGSILLATLTACNSGNADKLTLTATIDGITEGKAIIISRGGEKRNADTVAIQEGKFTYTGNYPEPTQITVMVGERGYMFFYVQNGKMTVNGQIDSLQKAVITGCTTQDDAKKVQDKTAAVYKQLNLDVLTKEFYEGKAAKTLSKEREAELTAKIDALSEQYTAEIEKINADFIKENPKSYYAAILVSQMASGKDAAGIEQCIAMLDESLMNTAIVTELRETMEEVAKTGVSFEQFIPNAHNLAYMVDKTYTGKQISDIIYLSVLSNDNLCCMKSDGTVVIVSPDGAKVTEFPSGLKSKAAVIATDKSDNIYVVGTVTETVEKTSRGKSYKQEVPKGVECLVLDSKGKLVREIKLSEIVTATGIRVAAKDLMIADTRGRRIYTFDLETGAKKGTIENLRTCCGILDFTTRNNSEILVANLGNFRVDGFDYTGKALVSFGQRGTGINDFHGCCNPVSVEFLSNGGIITVEKDPTRIKVYSQEGAKQIEGIEELVKGCAYIPVCVDSKDNIYLASKESGIVKCVISK